MFFKEVIVILSSMYCFWRNTPTYLPTYKYMPTGKIWNLPGESHLYIFVKEHIKIEDILSQCIYIKQIDCQSNYFTVNISYP